MINWKLRLKNYTTLSTLFVTVIAFVYQLLGLFNIVPSVSEDAVANLVLMILDVLAMVGIITDPTTAGFRDSKQALEYEYPRVEGDEING